ncbi:hypothetical protein NDU88_000883 [Pleurodeles waltl]|uniref:Uncharacterized protein n=1 Tax=Pleurodeles waltl TaxID=8319 RepID=A0AAV7LG01_PLEWA|nr:hypothetical protein NDU88_000883 [Pleurodeles waltl]
MVAGNRKDDKPGRKECRQERGAPNGDIMGDRQRTRPTGTGQLGSLQCPVGNFQGMMRVGGVSQEATVHSCRPTTLPEEYA